MAACPAVAGTSDGVKTTVDGTVMNISNSLFDQDGYVVEAGANFSKTEAGSTETHNGILYFNSVTDGIANVEFEGGADITSGDFVFRAKNSSVQVTGAGLGEENKIRVHTTNGYPDWERDKCEIYSAAVYLDGSANSATNSVAFENVDIELSTEVNFQQNFVSGSQRRVAGVIVSEDNARNNDFKPYMSGNDHVSFANSEVLLNFEIQEGSRRDNSDVLAAVILAGQSNTFTVTDSSFIAQSDMAGMRLDGTSITASGDRFIIDAARGTTRDRLYSEDLSGLEFYTRDRHYDEIFNSKETFISGSNGIMVNPDVVSKTGLGSFDFYFNSDRTVIEAKNTNGFFNETYGIRLEFKYPDNVEDYMDILPGNSLTFSGDTALVSNYQKGTQEVEASNKIALYGIQAGHKATIHSDSRVFDVFAGMEDIQWKEDVKPTTTVKGIDLTRVSALNIVNADRFSVITMTNAETIDSMAAISLSESSFDVSNSGTIIAAYQNQRIGDALTLDNNSSSSLDLNKGGFLLGNVVVSGNSTFDLKTSQDAQAGLTFIGALRLGESESGPAGNTSVQLLNERDVWLVTEDSSIANLKLENGATLNLATEDASNLAELGLAQSGGAGLTESLGSTLSLSDLSLDTDFHKVTLQGFTTSNANFRMRVSQDAEDTFDQIVFDGNSGSVNGTLDIVLSGDTKDLGFTEIADGFIRQENSDASVTLDLADRDGDGAADRYVAVKGAVFGWGLGFKGDGSEEVLVPEEEGDGTLTGTGAGNWLLVRTDDIPIEVQDAVAFGSSASQAISWLDGLEDLRQRLGDVRHGEKSGAWAKAFASKSRFTRTGFEQEVQGVHIGADASFASDAQSTWLAGASFRYSRADQEGLGEAAHGTSDMDEYAVKLYATYLHENGFYADFVAHAGWYEMDIEGRTNDFTSAYKADYGVLATGLSMEFGKSFEFAADAAGAWFVEPQMQFSILHVGSKSYDTSTDLEVHADGTDFVTGRLGFEAGRTMRLGAENDPNAQRIKLALLGGVTHEVDGESTVSVTGVDGSSRSFDAEEISGTRYYYGLSADWTVSDTFSFYGRLAREEGDGYVKDYDVSVGLRYMW